MKTNNIQIDTSILKKEIELLTVKCKSANFENDYRGHGHAARRRLFRHIRYGRMDIKEFNRRFASILTYELLDNGIFDHEIRNDANLAKLKQALTLIEEVQSSK